MPKKLTAEVVGEQAVAEGRDEEVIVAKHKRHEFEGAVVVGKDRSSVQFGGLIGSGIVVAGIGRGVSFRSRRGSGGRLDIALVLGSGYSVAARLPTGGQLCERQFHGG
jgi:hypothetical protein